VRYVCALLAAGLAVGCSPPDGPFAAEGEQATGTTESPLVGGTIAQAEKRVVSICTGADQRSCGFRCSGIVVAPGLVLTARHCANENVNEAIDCGLTRHAGNVVPASNTWVSDDTTFAQGVSKLHAAQRWSFPKATSFCGNDFALLLVREPLSSAPASIAIARPIPNQTGLALGYGSGRGFTQGTRRAANTTIQCVGNAEGCKSLQGASSIDRNEFVTDVIACDGDSGGTLLADDKVLGVLARTIATNNGCGNGVYQIPAAHALWLAREARAAYDSAKVSVPAWVAEAEAAGNGDPTRGYGAICDDDLDCASGLCRSNDVGGSWQCTQSCASAACPSASECVQSDAEKVCFRGTSPTGCCTSSVGLRDGEPTHGGAVLFATLLLLARRKKWDQ
jgi:hypothetical protein